LSHRFSLAHFRLCYNQDECCPMFFESDYFAPEVELLGRFKMRVYPKRLSIVEANIVEIVIINEAYSGTGYIKMALLKKDGQLYTVQGRCHLGLHLGSINQLRLLQEELRNLLRKM